MWRYLVGGAAALLMVGAGWLVFNGQAQTEHGLPGKPSAAEARVGDQPEGEESALPEAPARTREQKRFDRYDKDRDGRITRDEYLAARRKAFAKLDTNGDGRLAFDEWSVKTAARFAEADRDHSNAMSPEEFARTAPKRRTKPACRCPAPAGDDGA